ncbi:phosphatidylinositol phosphate kinase motif-containing protein [Pandoravirus inopinatum]|uniref:Phosphatidylinositol phosphate kinase motif-containing protein n=1 Tax=Pandoravirus inopinatum TaxID=1605721 RepID=A0A0B5J218_9VIRU|nr:phosphatidylinositol phosphate kinase motif-containing protein [Pandoravirus inopinatum]AJF97589.1 phosphatidylinositol phosphate kinase motif-containing protein [Pandoravirus inopinatum]
MRTVPRRDAQASGIGARAVGRLQRRLARRLPTRSRPCDLCQRLVYEGQWEKGLPHGHGKLNGTARTWTRGVCAAMGSWSRPLHDPDAPSYYGQYALLPESTRGLDFTSSRDTALREWWWITTAVGKRAPPAWTPLQPDTTRLPHGEGKAFYPDGKVYSGTWRLGQRHRGRCTLPDGTSFQGVWYHGGPRSTAIGNVSWSSGTHLKHEVVWDDQDRMRSDGGVVRSNTESTCMIAQPLAHAQRQGRES